MPVVSAGGATANSKGSRVRFCRQKRRSRKGAVVERSIRAVLEGWRDMLAVLLLM